MQNPLIGLSADRSFAGIHPIHTVGEKYLRAVVDGAGGIPVAIPAMADAVDHVSLLERLDGLLLTGGYSNIEPHHYQQQRENDEELRDSHRDANDFALLRAALDRGLPVLGICRGLQALNILCGGSLHQQLHCQGNYLEHREDKSAAIEIQYGPAHPIQIEAGGMLAQIWPQPSADVNSVHGQGIDRLGDGLRPEAFAKDGLIEAVSLPGAKGFCLAVQWHPEWKVTDNPFYLAIFKAFGEACRAYAASRSKGATV